MWRELRLIGSAWLASVAGIATFLLLAWAVFRPHIVLWGGGSALDRAGRFAALALVATVLVSAVVLILGMLSGMVLSARHRAAPLWPVGLGALVGGAAAFVLLSEGGAGVPAMTVFVLVPALSGAVTGWVFWWLALRSPTHA